MEDTSHGGHVFLENNMQEAVPRGLVAWKERTPCMLQAAVDTGQPSLLLKVAVLPFSDHKVLGILEALKHTPSFLSFLVCS